MPTAQRLGAALWGCVVACGGGPEASKTPDAAGAPEPAAPLASSSAASSPGGSNPGAPAVSEVAAMDGLIGAGESHVCTIGHEQDVWCWGGGTGGDLGDGSTVDRDRPVRVKTLANAVSVCAGGNYGCALMGDGAATCWGINHMGQLGSAEPRESAVPIAVAAVTDASAISCGHGHACAVGKDGSLRCWGWNEAAQVGRPYAQRDERPVVVAGLPPITRVSAGRGHTCAIDRDGASWCWGINNHGQLGDGTTTDRTSATRVKLEQQLSAIDAGDFATCAIAAADGAVWCWGSNESELVALGAPRDLLTPRRVDGVTGAVAISLGPSQTCALLRDGKVVCWGNRGVTGVQTAGGGNEYVHGPATIESLSGIRAVSAGAGFTCASNDAKRWCWGYLRTGLGDGSSKANSRVPVEVDLRARGPG